MISNGLNCQVVTALQKNRVALRPATQHSRANQRLQCVQIRNPAAPKFRLQMRKRAAELRLRMHRLHLRRRADGRLRRALAATHTAALAPIPRDNAVMPENQERLLRRLLVRQTLQKRHRLRMAELRFPCLACPNALFRSRPEDRRPPFAGLRKPPRDRPMLNLDAPDCNPPNADNQIAGEREKQTSPKNINLTSLQGMSGILVSCEVTKDTKSRRGHPISGQALRRIAWVTEYEQHVSGQSEQASQTKRKHEAPHGEK